MKDARDSGVPVWKQLSGRAEDKVVAPPKSPPKDKPFELPTDARGLVEALRKATVGPDKSTKITRMTMAKIYEILSRRSSLMMRCCATLWRSSAAR